MFIDTHAHFNICIDEGFSEEDLILQCGKNDIINAVQISTDVTNFAWSRELSKKYDFIYYAAGIHPSSNFNEDDLSTLEEIIDESVSEGEKNIWYW
jgi:TatD DNase family protein